jgi:probable phosphoglycerate mutase
MELLLIRHARPDRSERADGPADPGLTELGHLQAHALASWLADERIDALYTSPLRRARETAAPLATRLGLDAVVEPSLAEYDADASSYVPIEELQASGDQRWAELPEDVVGFQQDVVEGVERLVTDHASDMIALVCHGGVINVYLSWVVRSAHAMFFLPNYTSISRVLAASSGERSIAAVNETCHLRVAGVPLTNQPGHAG